jgi:hypothetical protein
VGQPHPVRNDGQLAHWADKEPRLKASIVVPYEDGEASAAEIRKRAGNNKFTQVFMLKGTLTLHAVKVSPGPVATEIAMLLGATNVTLTPGQI